MLIPAIPHLIDDFDISYNTSSWILTAYLIAGAVMTPIIGKMSDVYGKKKILLMVIMIYTLGSILGGISYNISMMLFARIVQGIGLAMFPIAFSIIREKFSEDKLAVGQGIFTAVFSAGQVVGLMFGATIVQYFSWHMTFLSIVPLLITLLFIVFKKINLSSENLLSKKHSNLDVRGTTFLIVLVASFLCGLTLLPNTIVSQNLILPILVCSLFGISIVFLPLFIHSQRKAKNPIVNLSLLNNRILLPTNVLIMTIGASCFIIYQTLPILIQSPKPLGFGGGPVDSANVQLPFMILTFVISVVSGFLIARIGNLKPTLLGCITTSIGFVFLFLYHPSTFMVSLELSIIAVGLALAEIGAFNVSLVSAPIHLSGTALGITILLFFIGMSIGPSISGIYLESFKVPVGNDGKMYPSLAAYNLIFLTAVLISMGSISLAVVIVKRIKYVTVRS